MSKDGFDATFYYYKPSGKWGYSGRGVFPEEPFFDREGIRKANDGSMPGIAGHGDYYYLMVIPDEDCDKQYAFPRMFHPVPGAV